MLALFESRVLLSRFLVPISSSASRLQYHTLESFMNSLDLALSTPPHACYINAFVHVRFHVLPLGLLILA
jgi:hypothetical protein